eukprot:777804-Prymnesium_polylepis.1
MISTYLRLDHISRRRVACVCVDAPNLAGRTAVCVLCVQSQQAFSLPEGWVPETSDGSARQGGLAAREVLPRSSQTDKFKSLVPRN